MIQRFFFDGIDLQCRRRSIAQAIKFSALIHTNEAKPRLPGMNVAMPRTKVAVHAPASLRLPPAPFVQFLGLLEDLQLAHRPILLSVKLYACASVDLCPCWLRC